MTDPFDGLPRAGDIETDRLRMRPLRLDDAEALFPVFDDERLHVFTGGAPATVEELRARLEAWSGERSPDGAQAWLNWLVMERGDDAPIGTVQATGERCRRGAHRAPRLDLSAAAIQGAASHRKPPRPSPDGSAPRA